MTIPQLYFTVGLPRSGKSTLCDQWMNGKVGITYNHREVLNNRFESIGVYVVQNKRIIVCGDDIRLALHGQRYQEEAEEYVSAIKHTMIKAYLNRGFDVLIDGTHTSQNSLDKLYKLSSDAIPIFIKTFADLCKARAIDSQQQDLIPIIDKMVIQLQETWGITLV